LITVAALVLVLSSCTGLGPGGPSKSTPARSSRPSASASPTHSGQVNVYAGAGAGKLSPTAQLAQNLVYVPSNTTNTVQVIDPSPSR